MKFSEFRTSSALWKEKGYSVPAYDRELMIRKTAEAPEWVHFGCGNIFRAFPARLCDEMLSRQLTGTGIVAAEGFDDEIIEKAYLPFDNCSVAVTLKADGSIDRRVIGSIAAAWFMDGNGMAELKKVFTAPSLKMASFTITEKGYSLRNAKGELSPAVAEDLEKGPEAPASYMGRVAALLLARYLAGGTPLAMVSMDNCSHNGDKLRDAITVFAAAWEEKGLAGKGFGAWIADPVRGVSFPISMIDKITPRPDDGVKKMLEETGFEDTDIIVTSKKSYTAPFVNAEECEYLVMEDAFPNGKLPLDQVSKGVLYTDRVTVDRVEKMKVGTCLNPLHTALAVFGCLLGYTKISDEMNDPDLKAAVERIGYTEGLPVVVDPGIISPKAFIDEVVRKRIPNPFMPDTPQRIATDTSQKLSVRFGQTVKAYAGDASLDMNVLQMIPVVYAGWCRYLMGIDDNGNEFTPSSDPMLEEVSRYVSGVRLGAGSAGCGEKIRPILSDERIFGVDLYKVGLGEKTERIFEAMCSGKGEVRNAIHSAL